MKETVVIFPNQLFEDHPALSPGREVILTEEPHFFKRYNFHRKKLILHRASMRYYRDYLTGKGYKANYVELDQAAGLSRALQGADRVHVADVVDHELARRLAKEVQKAHAELVTHETPMFLTPNEWIQDNLGTHEHFRLESFYEKQRKRLGILLEDSRPVGGKWSFDVENRKSLPAEEKKSNLFGHQRKIPSSFWRAETGIEPLDDVIGRLLRSAYAHHIERLMVLGSFMLLSEFDPDQVYRWFMELFIDAYDWVMVPNVYGLSQYADGGFLATKPYTSSSKYIVRMSNYRKGNWTDIWDDLYWRFLDKNRDLLTRSARMGLALAGLKRIKKDKLARYLGIAKEYLRNL